jgi:Flp pilus assembly protein TadG
MFLRLKTKLAIRIGKFRLMGSVLRLVRREDGEVIVEFALVAAPFLAVLFAIMETSLAFFAQETLETQTANATRLVLTGQQQSATAGQSNSQAAAAFAQKVCNSAANMMFDCSKMIIDVQTVSSFSSANLTLPIKNGQLDPSFSPSYNPGGPNCIVVVRVMYQWPVYVSLLSFSSSLGNNMSSTSGSQRLLLATSVFRNEPYGAPAC